MLTIAEHMRDYITGNIATGRVVDVCGGSSRQEVLIRSPNPGHYFMEYQIQNQKLSNDRKYGSLVDYFMARLLDIQSYEDWLMVKEKRLNVFTKLLFPLDEILQVSLSPLTDVYHDRIEVTE